MLEECPGSRFEPEEAPDMLIMSSNRLEASVFPPSLLWGGGLVMPVYRQVSTEPEVNPNFRACCGAPAGRSYQMEHG